MAIRGLFMVIRVDTIDNPIDNGWISILQQIEIQPFNFLYLCDMIDKAPKGLDKLFFV